MTITRITPMLVLALAACSPAPVRNESEPMLNVAEEDTDNILATPPEEALGNNAAAPKSILRPDVVEPEAAPPPLEPLDVVISFASSGTVLDDQARQALDAMLAEPAFAAGGKITLRGHSDSRGHDGDNLVASRKRAEAVRAYLINKKVAPDRITLVALGETRPIAPNAKLDGSDDPDGRGRNRRVEIEVSLPQSPARTPPPSAEANTVPAAATPSRDPMSPRT
ncbi:OmpA family protein [Sphingomonas jeddahensis]|uniref:Photosystem I P700 chlorophyll a apoprotein A2 n=1 Tax=Sphingomonas jeddahensis TaxID=1915074 RepID=A0A1V2ESU1_9SPHN|nr:OmpA family protein [Sphingomonas jeddahensis]ONF95358.1 Photosystem I P700 chlorophyll a apoprotein A2 [Sphingomonas jeddahensis]